MSADRRIYLDHAATTPVRPEVIVRMADVLGQVGNPSSVHGEGRAARRVLEDARTVVAEATGASPDQVIFTSGGTEANNLALHAVGGPDVAVSSIEHASVLEALPSASRIPVDQAGRLDLDALDHILAESPSLVSVMLVNNETGVVQDIPEIARRCRSAGVLLHVDAIQSLGKVANVRLDALGCDLATISAHKIGGPAGVGALVARSGLTVRARLAGGGQEGRRRAGTHNLAAIAGFAEAIRQLDPAEPARLRELRTVLEAGLLETSPASRVASAEADRAPHITSLVTPGRSAEMQVIRLDLAGIAVSAGAACSSGKVARSHVLAAMGLGADAGCAIRISLGWTTTAADIERFAATFADLMGGSSTGSKER
jgi:cysteine desulfurase